MSLLFLFLNKLVRIHLNISEFNFQYDKFCSYNPYKQKLFKLNQGNERPRLWKLKNTDEGN